MRKKIFLLFLCGLFLMGCSKNKDTPVDTKNGENEVLTQESENTLNSNKSEIMDIEQYSNETPYVENEDSIGNEYEPVNSDIEIMDDSYMIHRVIGKKKGDFISDDETFWVIATRLDEETGKTDRMFILTDVYEHIYKILYDTVIPDYNIETTISDNALVAYNNGNSSEYYHIIDSDGNDISSQYVNDNEAIMGVANDDNGISIFAVSTEETYSTQNVIFNVYDENKNCKFSFSKEEILEKYGIEWYWDTDYLKIKSIGNNTYYIDNDRIMNDMYMFVDTTREKVFPMSTPQWNGGVFSSDGTRILYYSQMHGCVVIDIDTEISQPLNGIKYGDETAYPRSAMWNGKFIAEANSSDYALYDYQGNLICDLESESANVTAYTNFYDGHSLIELVNDGGTSFVTVINENGEWQFDPIQGSINSNSEVYLKKAGQFLAWENDGSGAFLIDKTGNKMSVPIPKANYDFIVTEINGETQYLLYLGNNTEKFIRVTASQE